MTLVCDQYKFIFIHIPKTGGTSIRRALIHALLPKKFDKLTDRFMQNESKIIAKFKSKIAYEFFNLYKRIPDHSTAMEARSIIGCTKYDSYFSFCFCRNPYDWHVSNYNYTLNNTKHMHNKLFADFRGFDEYIEWACAGNTPTQKSFIADDRDIKRISLVARFENLEQDFYSICSKVRICCNPRLDHFNRSRNTMDTWEGYYSKWSRKKLLDTFEEDFRFLQYNP
jgi:hypothetical protein